MSISAQEMDSIYGTNAETILKQQLVNFVKAINAAEKENASLDLSGIKMTASAKDLFFKLWGHFHIKTIEDFFADDYPVIQLDGGKAGYNVRDIGVTLIPKHQFSGDSLQQFSIYFLPDGTICDVCIALEHKQYRTTVIGIDKDDLYPCLTMLSFCEKLKTAYYSKNMDLIEQSLENNLSDVRHTDLYLNNYRRLLKRVFAREVLLNYSINDINITLSSVDNRIYGLSIKQSWSSIHYQDTNLYFSLWDFRNPLEPIKHIVAIQSADTPEGKRIGLDDFDF